MPVPGSNESTNTSPDIASALANSFKPAGEQIFAEQQRHLGDPSPAFLLRHHPKNWLLVTEGLDGPTLIPEFCRWGIVVGSHGIRTVDEGQAPVKMFQRAKRVAEDEGWYFADPGEALRENEVPPGLPPGGYLRAVDVRDRTGRRGKSYQEVWDVPYAPFADEPVSYRRNAEARGAYNRWCLRMLQEGRVRPPHPAVVERLKGRMERRLGRVLSLTNLNEKVRDERASEVKGRIDKLETAANPKPTKPARKPRKGGPSVPA